MSQRFPLVTIKNAYAATAHAPKTRDPLVGGQKHLHFGMLDDMQLRWLYDESN